MKNLIFIALAFLMLGCSKEVEEPGAISQNPDSLNETSGSWKQVANFPDMRTGSASFSIGNKGYVMGGTVDSDFGFTLKRDLWEFDPNSNTWTKKADFPDSGRINPVAFSINGKGYVGIGIARNGNFLRSFWEYDPSNNTWTRRADFKGQKRVDQASFAVGGKGYVGTGFCDPDQLSDFWQFDPGKNKWERIADFPGIARMRATGLSIGDMGYVGFGFSQYTEYQEDFYEYNPKTNVWTQKASLEGEPRLSALAFTIGNNGYVGLGYFDDFNVGYRSDVWQYNSIKNVWTKQKDFPGLARVGATSFSINNKGYLGLGSAPGTVQRFNDFWEFSED